MSSALAAPPSPTLRAGISGGPSFGIGSQLPLNAIMQAIKPAPQPDEAVKEKIVFVFNNVSKQNMEAKANELCGLLGSSKDHLLFVAQHLVVNRASTEPNFHQLYMDFLDSLKISKLHDLVLKSTYAAIKALLQSPRITASSSERTLLKNLGSWLGNLTLARNKALIHKHLALKV